MELEHGFDIEAEVEKQRAETLEVFRRETPEEMKKEVERVGDSLKSVLYQYVNRPENDPEVTATLERFVNRLEHALLYGESDKPLPSSMRENVKIVLGGAQEILDDPFIRIPIQSSESGSLERGQKFVDLAKRKFNKNQ